MNRSNATATKTPDKKREASVSRSRKTDSSLSKDSPIERILHLQRTVGNQAVGNLLKTGALQAQLRIGSPTDLHEQKADRTTGLVMPMPTPPIQLDATTVPKRTLASPPPIVTSQKKFAPVATVSIPAAKTSTPAAKEGTKGADEEKQAKILPLFPHLDTSAPSSTPKVLRQEKKAAVSVDTATVAIPGAEGVKPDAPVAGEPAKAEGLKLQDATGEEKSRIGGAGEEKDIAPEIATVDRPAVATTVKLHMPEPPAGILPATMRRIKSVQSRAGGRAAAHAALPSGASQVGDARQAVTEPDAEATAKAQAELIRQVQAAPSPEIVKLCERIRDVIKKKRPPDQDALMEAKPEAEAADAGNQLNSTVQGETSRIQDNYGSLNNPAAAGAPVKGRDLPPQPAAAGTPPVNAQAATPDAVTPGNVSLDADVTDNKKKMQDAGMETPAAQLVQSGPVADARGAQAELEKTAQEGPAKVLAGQKKTLTKAEGDMAALQAQALAALTTSRDATVKNTSSRQKGMVGSEESMRAKAGAEAKKTFDDAKIQVTTLLKPLASNAMAEWEAAKEVLVSQFKADLAIVQKRVEERHAGVGGWFVGLWDAVTGLPGWAEEAYTKAEKKFGDGVIAKLTTISANVNSVIATCDLLIKNARNRIKEIFTALPESLQGWAAQEQAKFDGQLDHLHNEVIAARDKFNKDLVERSSQAVDEVRTEIAELRKKAGGLVGRIVSAVNRFLEDPVKFIIEGLLDLLGIPPASFWAVVAKIRKFVKDIADDPLKFAENMLKGLGKGFSLFFDNIFSHLIKGFISWLTGGLGNRGVQLPKDFSLKSIITFFLQLMGITWPRIRKILAKHVGEKNVALLEKVYSLVSFLIDKGPEGIYEMIKEKLDPKSIVDQVVQLAVDFLISAVVKAVSVRILLLFNPVGAILQALEAIYRVLKWIFQNAARIFTLIETVVNGIADILSGSIGGFAKAVEIALGMLIAPVISFLADYLGFGDLPSKIAEKIKSFQEWILGLIEKALVWIIEKGKALLAAMGIGGKDKEKKKEEKHGGQIGVKMTWMAGGENHELWVGEAGGEPEAMMASGTPGMVRKKLAEYAEKAKNLKGPGSKNRKKRAITAIGKASQILDETNAAAKATKKAQLNPEGKVKEVEAKESAMENWERQLWPKLQIIEIAFGQIKLPDTVVRPGSGDKASKVVANPLSKKGRGGSAPRGKLKGWQHVLDIDHEKLNPKKGQWGPAYWVAGHLLSERLHGPGDPWNTVPLRKIDNKAMELGVEKDTIKRKDDDEVLFYEVQVDYHSGDILEDFPSYIEITRGLLEIRDDNWEKGEGLSPFGRPLKPPPLDPDYIPDLNDLSRNGFYKRNVPIRFAMAIVEERDTDGIFQHEVDFVTRMTRIYGGRTRPSNDKLTEGLVVIDKLIKRNKLRIGGT